MKIQKFGFSEKSPIPSEQRTLTTAVETEERLLGPGPLPRDVVAEEEREEAVRRAIGPPEPVLE